MFDLTGRVALVTGSARGIGRAIAEGFAAAGAAIVVHGKELVEVEDCLQHCAIHHWRAIGSTVDLEAPQAATLLRETVEAKLGAPDILVLNASIEIRQGWRNVSAEAMQRQNTINVQSSVELIQAFLPAMLERGWGRILAVGSVQEERPNASHFFYVATKAALTSLVLNLARNERSRGVTFNVLRPGAILTDRNRTVLADPAYAAAVLERIPVGRIGAPQDCVGAAVLLCSDAGAYINGTVLSVDGGMHL